MDQVAQKPSAVALRHRGVDHTYAEIDAWSDHYAARLQGLPRHEPVGILSDRGPELVAAIITMLKTGRGFLPLDPELPIRRLKIMVEEARICSLLTQKKVDHFGTLDLPRVPLELPAVLESRPSASVPNPSDEPALFHIVYTSGSLGRPKGVRIGCDAVLNRLHWMWQEYPFSEGDVMGVQKSFGLVASPWEMLGGLLQGIPSVILTQDEVVDRKLLVDALVRERVTHVFLNPFLIANIIDEIEQRGSVEHRLKLVTSGGDHLSPELVFRFQRHLPGVRLLNLYGMTETSSNVAAYDTINLPASAVKVPVGQPVANSAITLVDRYGRLVPPGVLGEILISGRALAMGYLDDSHTQDRFVVDKGGARVYRTGDLGRWLQDGNLEIVGRVDDQVKVRGYRVEVQEVETILRKARHVQEAAVCVNTSETLSCVLVTDGKEDITAIRAFLRDHLPSYMIPDSFTVVAKLPLGPTGKLDRVALRDVVKVMAPTVGSDRVDPPQGDIETALAEIWREVLKLDYVGRQDNFFDLGGHSLIATQLISRIRAVLGVDISVRSLFDGPKLFEQADEIGRKRPGLPVSGRASRES